MTLLAVLSRSGHIDHIEDLSTPGLAAQAARGYTDSGVACRIIPDDMKEDVLYLMGQVKEERNNGFVEERGVVPNGHPKKSGARGFGRMILPPFGGMIEESEGVIAPEGQQQAQPEEGHLPPLPFSSKKRQTASKKIGNDIIFLRRD